MSINFEGEPPFHLGIAETASAHVLDTTVVVRVTVFAPEMRPQHVTVRFTVASDVAKVLAEQLLMAARMAETRKQL